MNWYITKIVFKITSKNEVTTNQFDEQLRLVKANSNEEAFLKARTIGLSEEDSFYNDNNNLIKWEFVNVAEVLPIRNLEDGMELYSCIHETEEATTYIDVVHKKAIAIRLSNSTAR